MLLPWEYRDDDSNHSDEILQLILISLFIECQISRLNFQYKIFHVFNDDVTRIISILLLLLFQFLSIYRMSN